MNSRWTPPRSIPHRPRTLLEARCSPPRCALRSSTGLGIIGDCGCSPEQPRAGPVQGGAPARSRRTQAEPHRCRWPRRVAHVRRGACTSDDRVADDAPRPVVLGLEHPQPAAATRAGSRRASLPSAARAPDRRPCRPPPPPTAAAPRGLPGRARHQVRAAHGRALPRRGSVSDPTSGANPAHERCGGSSPQP